MNRKRVPQKHRSNGSISQTIQHVTHYEGAIPHPDILRGINEIVPGSAQTILNEFRIEAEHRRNLEIQAMESNFKLQSQQLEIAQQQSIDTYKSDLIGQKAGFVVSVMCIFGAVLLGINNHDWLAGAIAAVPTAALIKAFTLSRSKND